MASFARSGSKQIRLMKVFQFRKEVRLVPMPSTVDLVTVLMGKPFRRRTLSNPNVTAKYSRSLQLLARLRKDINGQPHTAGKTAFPQEAADIAKYVKSSVSGGTSTPRFTLSNYVNALVGYRGRSTCCGGVRSGQTASWVKLVISGPISSTARHGTCLFEQPACYNPCHRLDLDKRPMPRTPFPGCV